MVHLRVRRRQQHGRAKMGGYGSHRRARAGEVDPYLRRGQLSGQQPIQGGAQQLFPQDLGQMLCYDLLLLPAAVVLQGQDDWIV